MIICAGLLLQPACAPLEQKPVEVRTQIVEVKIPTPVPCFREEDRPVMPAPTPIDIDRASVDQLGAALAADAEALEQFSKIVDALFLQCSKGGTK